ncbi:MAG: SLBB domain-containing protein [Candidatus Marinimicrobia bacterium]|nr:SLBB domain-containing protein [Candidatus Neomarinimicrobiota bacterium]
MFVIALLIFYQGFGQTYGKRFLHEQDTEAQPINDQLLSQPEYDQNFFLEKAVNPDEYILGPGDKLGISISTDRVLNFNLVVSPTEEILIPGVGLIDIHQLSLTEARNKIATFIQKNAYQNARVGVVLANIRIFNVQISGAVNEPGFYKITPETRLHEVIEKAEGFHQLAKEMEIQIIQGTDENLTVNYLQYIRTGDLKNNPKLKEGDQIFVPFANIKTDGIVIRGSITGSGYDIIEEGETLESFLWRRAKFSENADLESVKITRIENGLEKYITVFPEDFKGTVLLPGDQIDILGERGVSVIGFVQAPGGYRYFPGYSTSDYISLAGGNTVEGDAGRAVINHLDGNTEKAKNGTIRRGDVIVVPRTRQNVLFGNSSILQITVSVFSIVLTYIAATK